MTKLLLPFLSLLILCSCASQRTFDSNGLVLPEESAYLSNMRQLTFEGENAEGYFSFDETKFCYQHRNVDSGLACDQIYMYDLATGRSKRISIGLGRTTCSYFLPGDSMILYATTHLGNPACPPPPDQSHGYVWAVDPKFEIVVSDTSGHIRQLMGHSPGYDAEATVSPTGDKIVFTSSRTGDIELFTMGIDGSNVKQLTNVPGYDGGANYSWDGKKIVFRASRPEGKELAQYKKLLKRGLVMPSKMELFVMNEDGSGMKQITHNGAANFAPFWHPDGEHIIFASNIADTTGRNFDLYTIRQDGSDMRRITYSPTFDAFPMLTHDGKRLIFASNRHSAKVGETNLFICDFKMP